MSAIIKPWRFKMVTSESYLETLSKVLARKKHDPATYVTTMFPQLGRRRTVLGDDGELVTRHWPDLTLMGSALQLQIGQRPEDAPYDHSLNLSMIPGLILSVDQPCSSFDGVCLGREACDMIEDGQITSVEAFWNSAFTSADGNSVDSFIERLGAYQHRTSSLRERYGSRWTLEQLP